VDMNLVENGNGKCFAGIDNQALYSDGASNGEGKREGETLKIVAATTETRDGVSARRAGSKKNEGREKDKRRSRRNREIMYVPVAIDSSSERALGRLRRWTSSSSGRSHVYSHPSPNLFFPPPLLSSSSSSSLLAPLFR